MRNPMRRPIRNYTDDTPTGERLCDAVVSEKGTILEFKMGKRYVRMPWPDVIIQVEAAEKAYEMSE